MSFVIRDLPPQLDARVLEKLARAETATIGHLRQQGFADRRIQCIQPGARIAGTAVTVAIPGQDSALLHHALGLLRPGDVLVIDRLGDDRHACLGGGVAVAAKAAGAVAAIVDGPCTDFSEIRAEGFPVWCKGPSAITTRIYGIGGAFNTPISCGGVVVNPGDAVLADESGVLFMSADVAEAMADWALEKMQNEPKLHQRLRAGEKLGDISGASQIVVAKLSQQSSV
ncbi:MAG: RraA family protein [Burkholderiales bacterium]|nr:MAG: RraA family protein [Burkholderiales bacterium]